MASVRFGMDCICLNILPHGVKLCVKAYVNGFKVVESGVNVCVKVALMWF